MRLRLGGVLLVVGISSCAPTDDFNELRRARGAITVEETTLLASDGAPDARFGASVAVSGDTALVGAYGDNQGPGAVYVFVRSGSEWLEQQKLVASAPEVNEGFGWSVALSGDTALVGAPSNSLVGGGSAYVFQRTAGMWSDVTQLNGENLPDGASYGHSVALTDDLAFVGAPDDDVTPGGGEGTVDIRRRSDWSRVQRLQAFDGTPDDRFGMAVAASADVLFVGAPGIGRDGGAVYRYDVSGEDFVWGDTVVPDDVMADGFGRAISVSGNTALIGEFADNVDSNLSQGSVYLLERSGSSWLQPVQLHASDGAMNDSFGFDVAISGDLAVIGAPSDAVGANESQGSAYVFVRSGNAWVEKEQLLGVTGAGPIDGFGTSVALFGRAAIVGAEGAGSSSGRAHAFLLDPPLGGTGGVGGTAGQNGAGVGGASGGAGDGGDHSGGVGGGPGAGTGGRVGAGGAAPAGASSLGGSSVIGGTTAVAGEMGSGTGRQRSSSESGCGCRTAPARSAPIAHIFMLAVLAIVASGVRKTRPRPV